MSYTDIFGGQTVPPSEYSYVKYTLTEDAQLYWPAAAPPEGRSIAKITEISAAFSVTVTLYQANQVSVGFDFIISNTGSELVAVNDFDGNELFAIAPGSKVYFYITDNSSEAGAWRTTEYGASTSVAQAMDLAGAGLASQAGKLVVNAPSVIINTDYIASSLDLGHVLVVRTGTVTVTMPSLISLVPTGFYCFLRNDSVGSTQVNSADGATVDGSLVKEFAPGEAAILFATDSGWLTVGYGRDVTFAFTEFVVNAAGPNPTLSPSDVSGRMIRVVGVATEDKTITLPPVTGIYFVTIESNMGIFEATFTTGLGVFVTLHANQSTALYCDGANIRVAISSTVQTTLTLLDGSAAAPTLFWETQPNTGFYRAGNHTVGFTANGVLRFTMQSTGYNGPAVITGGAITNIADLSIADGGTGASTASGARNNLGLFGLGGSAPSLIDANNLGMGTIYSANDTEAKSVAANLPSLGGGGTDPRFWAVFTCGTPNRTVQEATEVFGIGTTRGRTFRRVKHDATWHPWLEELHPANPYTWTAPQVFSAFTKLGASAPGIKVYKDTGITPTAHGEATGLATPIPIGKILSFSVLVDVVSPSVARVAPDNTTFPNAKYSVSLTGATASLTVAAPASGANNILNRPFTLFLTYEE